MAPMIGRPRTISPSEDGIVSSNTNVRDRDKVLRNSSKLLTAALRETDGRRADAKATPKTPSGNCMKRKAYVSQLTGPSGPRSGSERREAKLVFTVTLIWTAVLTRIAGPIRRKICCNPGCDQLKAGLKLKPNARRLGICQTNCSTPPNTTPYAIPTMGVIPIYGPSQKPSARPKQIEPMLKKLEAMAGTPNLWQEFNMPMTCAASAIRS